MKNRVTLGVAGTIAIPAAMRERLGLKADDELIIEDVEQGLLVRRLDAEAEDASLGETGGVLAAETLPVEDFSAWDARGG